MTERLSTSVVDAHLFSVDAVAFLRFVCDRFTFHSHAGYDITLLSLEGVVPLCRHVYRPRIHQARELIARYERAQLSLFRPTGFGERFGKRIEIMIGSGR